MSIETVTIREKTTSNIDMILKADGQAIDLTNVDHVSMYMIDSEGEVYRYNSSDSPAHVSVQSATGGTVRFVPPSENVFQYVKSPYKLFWWVWETSSKKYAVPEEGYAQIKLEKEY